MLTFKLNKEKSDSNFKISECEIKDCRFTIIKWKEAGLVSVFVRKDVCDKLWQRIGYIEIWDHRATDWTDAKRLAEKLYDIVLWYKPVELWKE